MVRMPGTITFICRSLELLLQFGDLSLHTQQNMVVTIVHGGVWQFTIVHGDVWYYGLVIGGVWQCTMVHGGVRQYVKAVVEVQGGTQR